MNAPLRTMAELVQALRDARDERGVTHENLDAIAGVPGGYTSKVLAPSPIRHVGYKSLGDIMGALGKALVMVDDPEAIAKVQRRWVKRKRPQKLDAGKQDAAPSLASVVSISERMKEIRKLVKRESLSNAGKRRLKTMKKRARQRVASHAARMRWSKSK